MRNLSLKEMRKVAVMFVLFVSVAVAGLGVVSEKQISTQQVGVGCGYMAGETEDGASGAWGAASNWCVGISSGMAVVGAGGILVTGTNPVGWGYWATTGVLAL